MALHLVGETNRQESQPLRRGNRQTRPTHARGFTWTRATMWKTTVLRQCRPHRPLFFIRIPISRPPAPSCSGRRGMAACSSADAGFSEPVYRALEIVPESSPATSRSGNGGRRRWNGRIPDTRLLSAPAAFSKHFDSAASMPRPSTGPCATLLPNACWSSNGGPQQTADAVWALARGE